jgi:hypothetical protein
MSCAGRKDYSQGKLFTMHERTRLEKNKQPYLYSFGKERKKKVNKNMRKKSNKKKKTKIIQKPQTV